MILNIYKSISSTSLSNVKEVRNITNEKVGHGSSLGLFADGVFVPPEGENFKT